MQTQIKPENILPNFPQRPPGRAREQVVLRAKDKTDVFLPEVKPLPQYGGFMPSSHAHVTPVCAFPNHTRQKQTSRLARQSFCPQRFIAARFRI